MGRPRARAGGPAGAGACLPRVAAGRPPAPVGGVPDDPSGPQGGGRWQRRHRHLDRPAAGPGSRIAAAAPDQGGEALGARALHGALPVLKPGPPGGHRPAADAGGERRLPWLGATPAGCAGVRLLRPPASRLEGVGRRRRHDQGRLAAVGNDVRLDAGARPCPVGRPRGDRVLPRQLGRSSTGPSPSSPGPTPTRTTATTAGSRLRLPTVGWRRVQASRRSPSPTSRDPAGRAPPAARRRRCPGGTRARPPARPGAARRSSPRWRW